METGGWAIPYSCTFVILKINNFDPFQCSINVNMKMILRIKFAGLPQ